MAIAPQSVVRVLQRACGVFRGTSSGLGSFERGNETGGSARRHPFNIFWIGVFPGCVAEATSVLPGGVMMRRVAACAHASGWPRPLWPGAGGTLYGLLMASTLTPLLTLLRLAATMVSTRRHSYHLI